MFKFGFSVVLVVLLSFLLHSAQSEHAPRKRGHPVLGSELHMKLAARAANRPNNQVDDDDLVQDNNGTALIGAAKRKRRILSGPNGIKYLGGSVIAAHKVFYIWYGNWSATDLAFARGMLENMARGIGSSTWWSTATTYVDRTRRTPRTGTFGGSYFDLTYTNGTNTNALDDGQVWNIVTTALTARKLPVDPNGIYIIVPSKEVTEVAGACMAYCAYHSNDVVNGVSIKYAFINNPTQCPNACIKAKTGSPNGDAVLDAMASMIAHELVEAVTDPHIDAWRNDDYTENADMCSWNFGQTTTVNGTQHNLVLNRRRYLIQQNWVNAKGGYCAMKYP